MLATVLAAIVMLGGPPTATAVPSFVGCYEPSVSGEGSKEVAEMLPSKLRLLPLRKRNGRSQGRVRGYAEGKEVVMELIDKVVGTAWEPLAGGSGIEVTWGTGLFGPYVSMELRRDGDVLAGPAAIYTDEIGGPVVSSRAQLTPISCARLMEK